MPDSIEIEKGSRIGPPPLPENYGRPLAPVDLGERIVSLDVLRGIALLGILISNLLYFSQPLDPEGERSGLWFGPMDRVADWISVFLIEGKFYPLFSFLFGLGFSIQMKRASSRGLDFKSTYRRRLFVLMGLGLLHGVFLWEGDVLFAYSVCGFVLLLFRNRKPLTILIWAAVFIILPALFMSGLGLIGLALSGNAEFAQAMRDSFQEDIHTRRELVQAFVTGGYADAVFYRLGELILTIVLTTVFSPVFLGLFLIGMLVGRKGIIADVREHRRFLVWTLVVCGAVGLLGNFVVAWMMVSGSAGADFGLVLMATGVLMIFGPVLTGAYISGVVLLLNWKPSLPSLSAIAAVGRMALTNYLAQSLIATTIFYGYGFGLGGSVGRLGTIGIALIIFAAQVAFSMIWLRFFRYGPMEWVWRSLTYGKRQPMRRDLAVGG